MNFKMPSTHWLIIMFMMSGLTNGYGQAPEKRIALVIGAQNYTVLPPLRNSLNDAKTISSTLQKKGFEVKSILDPRTRTEIKDGINWYFNQMREREGAVGLIYYAGHGMQYQGENYIIPTTASLQNPGDLEDYCVKMNTIIAILNSSTKSLNILLLDACRSLPSFTRGVEQGLTKMDAPEGAIIVFATQPGKVASDGYGVSGLFTSKLAMAIDEPGLNVTDVFQRVKREVYAESNKQQLPSVEDNAIGGDFYFTTGERVISTTGNGPMPVGRTEVVTTAFDYGYGVSDVPTVTIGSQVWISKNLNVDHFANGDPIPEAKTALEWKEASDKHAPAWCYFENDPAYGKIYGKLYNWYAVTDPRGLAPRGWHVPNDNEWGSIIGYLDESGTIVTKPVTKKVGKSLKTESGWKYGGNGNNSSGFTGLPGGTRNLDTSFSVPRSVGAWWSTTEQGTDGAWVRSLSASSYGEVYRYNQFKSGGLSVRCVKD